MENPDRVEAVRLMVEDAVEGVRFGMYPVFEVDVVEVEGVRRDVFIVFWYDGVVDETGV